MNLGSRRQVLFLFLINLVGLTIAQSELPDLVSYSCITNTRSSLVYQANRDNLLSSLAENTDKYGFYSASYGENPYTVYAIVLCRADVDLDICRACISYSTSNLTQLCPTDKEAIGWYDYCMLRYSNKLMKGIMAGDPRAFVSAPRNVTNGTLYTQAMTLLDSLRDKAASGGSLRKFATGNSSNVYGLLQCTPDISEDDCRECLLGAMYNFPMCCNGSIGGSVLRPSCHLQYNSTERFFNDIPPDAPPPASPLPASPLPHSRGKDDNTPWPVIIAVVSALSFVTALVASICILLRKRKQMKLKHKVENSTEISSVESLQYDFDGISIATNNFSDANKLGQGGFGTVYQGRLPNGQKIAVKRLAKDSGQRDLEFKNEVMLVAKLQHRNLVRLLGFCLEGTERLLIYEFMTNSSLDHFLFDPNRRAQLDWDRRFKIIGGIARGLLYLHEDSRLRIIHRDLKASNVLLDAEMNPKISDFGTARLFVPDQTHDSTNRIVGT